jgi:hypothetical protein
MLLTQTIFIASNESLYGSERLIFLFTIGFSSCLHTRFDLNSKILNFFFAPLLPASAPHCVPLPPLEKLVTRSQTRACIDSVIIDLFNSLSPTIRMEREREEEMRYKIENFAHDSVISHFNSPYTTTCHTYIMPRLRLSNILKYLD